MSDCSACPLRDVGKSYDRGDPNDPYRRMPRLMERLVRVFGGQLYNRQSRTRRDLDKRLQTYCSRVRAVHGDDCSPKRMRFCCATVHRAVRVAERAQHPYPQFRYALSHLLDDDAVYGELHRTRNPDYAPDVEVSFRVLDHCN